MKYLLPLLTAIILSACSTQTPEMVKNEVALGASQYIQFGVKADKQSMVATDFTTLSNLPLKTTHDPVEFASALRMYLPDSPSKQLSITEATSLYAAMYPIFSHDLPSTQVEYAQAVLSGLGVGASPWMSKSMNSYLSH